MRESMFCLAENRALTGAVHLMRFSGDASAITSPGQFVSIEVPGKFLRRPFSVCDWGDDWFSVLVERVGSGTEALHAMPVGTEASVLTGLGRGYTLLPGSKAPLLIGGGTGLSPLVGLARRLKLSGIAPQVLLGFRNPADSFGADLFPGLSVTVTDDVFSALAEIPHDCFYACGSEAMMSQLVRLEPTAGQVAFDVRMGCGFGACMGCAVEMKSGMRRICKDGPVFDREEILWASLR